MQVFLSLQSCIVRLQLAIHEKWYTFFMSPPLCGWDIITHVCNSEIKQLWPLLAKYLVVTTFCHCLEIWTWFFGIWVYNDELQITFTFRSNSMIFWQSYGPWTLKFGQIFSCHHFISLWFEILTWFLVWECIIISYRSTNFEIHLLFLAYLGYYWGN